MTATLKIGLGILVLFVVIAVAFFSIERSPNGGGEGEVNQMNFYETLKEKNNDFAYAESLFKSGKYDEAAEYYTRALENAEDTKEEGQLKHKIAISYNQAQKTSEAVALFKEVAKNESYTARTRAYAVQNIGKVLYSQNSDEMRIEVFKDEPYSSFLPIPQDSLGREEDYSIATRKLFEYATSLYPLAISELRVAKWYSARILEIKNDPLSTPVDIGNVIEYRKIVLERLASADAFINNMEVEISDEETRNVDLSEILWRKGSVLTDLMLAGEEINTNIEALYKRSHDLGLIRPRLGASTKFQYAIFLARTDKQERRNDILSLLSDFYETIEKAPALEKSIAGEKDNSLDFKDDLILLSEIDPRFKEYLVSLGWEI